MDVVITRSNDVFLFDAKVSGYDTAVWKTISGTPAVVSNKIQINAAEINSHYAFRNVNLEFLLTIQTAPTAGDERQFGLKSANFGNKSALIFYISGANFSARAYDEAGNLIASYVINWDSNWTNTESRFRISTSERNVFFSINDTIVAKFEDVLLTKLPLSVNILNTNADDLLLSSVSAY